MSRTISRSRPSPAASPRAPGTHSTRRVEANTDRMLEPVRARGRAGRRSSPWAGSPSGTRRWSAASSPPGTNSRATAMATSARMRTTARLSPPMSRRAKRVLEDIGGVPVIGYRAATFSIGRAIRGLSACSSERATATAPASIPMRHDLYGDAGRLAHPFRPGDGALWEIPMTTVRAARPQPAVLGRRLFPAAALRAVPSSGSHG